MRLFIIRHADPEKDRDALTPAGRSEAKALAASLAPIGLDEIYCSPLKRALETAGPISGTLHQKPVVLEWLREFDWILSWKKGEARSAWNLPGENVRADLPYRLPNEMLAEFEEFKQASDHFLKKSGYERAGHRYRPVQSHERKIALFTHGGVGLSWLAHLLDLPLTLFWSGFWIDPCSVTTIHFEQHSPEWAVPRCIGLNDISHLRAAGLPPQASSIFRKFA